MLVADYLKIPYVFENVPVLTLAKMSVYLFESNGIVYTFEVICTSPV